MWALLRRVVAVAGVLGIASAAPASALGQGIESRFIEVNGLRMHYLVAGNGGSQVILLHGYA
jgi:hypothetical protein